MSPGGCPAHVTGTHRGSRVGWQEVKHRSQDNGYRLGHIDHRADLRIREHGLRLGQVCLHSGEPVAASKQHLLVKHGHGVYVYVAHPSVRDYLPHRLVHRRVRGQPGAEVDLRGTGSRDCRCT
jgi:hypothetical protein